MWNAFRYSYLDNYKCWLEGLIYIYEVAQRYKSIDLNLELYFVPGVGALTWNQFLSTKLWDMNQEPVSRTGVMMWVWKTTNPPYVKYKDVFNSSNSECTAPGPNKLTKKLNT